MQLFTKLKKFLSSGFRATLNFLKFKVALKLLKAKLRVFLTDQTVAMVTNDVIKMTTTCSAMIGNLFDIIIVAATDKDL